MEFESTDPIPSESEDGDVGEIVARLGFSLGEVNLDATLVVESIGRRGHIPIKLSGPRLAHLGEKRSAGIVVIGVFGKQENGEDFFFAFIGDRGEVEVGDGDGLVDEVVGGEFLASSHEVGQGQSFRGDFSKHNFFSSSSGCQPLNFFLGVSEIPPGSPSNSGIRFYCNALHCQKSTTRCGPRKYISADGTEGGRNYKKLQIGGKW